ncbi:hypothetical protein [Paenibacillus jamilae]|nr:hypothetical protein [Paenibacillus jamilae]
MIQVIPGTTPRAAVALRVVAVVAGATEHRKKGIFLANNRLERFPFY